ncbi:MAG: Gfo/Idh/MocA family protein [Bacteroidota bacterium]
MTKGIRTNRRDFIRTFSLLAGASMVVSQIPWLERVNAQDTNKIVKLGIIGPGSRGKYLLLRLLDIPGLEITCFCDNYEPNYQKAQQMLGSQARGYVNYKDMLEKEDIDAIIIATPLFEHARMTVDALDAGIHVFCEKSLAKTYEEANEMVKAHKRNGKILMPGHQRMFSLKYQKAYKMIQDGKLGDITHIRAFWHRNNDWRRHVPSPELERKINWRLYHDYSLGLVTELASHQVQVANQILGEVPEYVTGSGSINYWKDGREVFDNINMVYKYPCGTHLLYDSNISNNHYGLEEQVMGNLGTMELEKGKMFEEFPPPAPAILKLINHMENQFFDAVPIGGASWVPETAEKVKGEYIYDGVLDDDGSRMMLEAFISFVRDDYVDTELTKQGFYSSIASTMAFEAIMENKIVYWPKNLEF